MHVKRSFQSQLIEQKLSSLNHFELFALQNYVNW